MKPVTDSGAVRRATVASIVCHTCWGFSFLASRTALNTADVFVLLSHRFLLAFLLMHLAVGKLRAQRWTARQFLLMVLLGTAQPVLYFFGEQYGILHSSTIFSGVMIAMIPVASTLAAAVFLREKPTLGQLAFSLLSVGGVIGIGLLSGSSGRLDLIGILALVLAVVSAATYTLLSRNLSREVSAFSRTYVMMGVGALSFTVLALIQCGGSLNAYLKPLQEPSYLLSVGFLAAFCSVLSFFCSSYALSKLPVARETVFANLTTTVSVFAGVLFLHEPFSWLGAVFCLLILLGIYGVQRSSKPT
jgi:drug/metabolite transporter (DMT)-like permease